MLPRFPSAVRLLVPAFFAAFLVPAGSVRGQRIKDGDEALEAKARGEYRTLIQNLRKGVDKEGKAFTFNPDDKDHAEALDVMVKLAVYPFAWRKYHSEPGKIQKTFEGFEADLLQLSRRKVPDKLLTHHAKKVIERAEDVLADGRPIAAVNACRVLARLLERDPKQKDSEWQAERDQRLGDGNANQLAGVLLKVVGDPKLNDGAKVYALRALGRLLAVPADREGLKDKEREKAINAVLQFVQRKPNYPDTAPKGHQEAFSVVRGEGVQALAQARSPGVGEKDKVGVVLLRIVAKDARVVPEPRLGERLEAAIALAGLRPGSKETDYQADYAAEHIGRLVSDFLTAANANVEKRKPSERLRPWKVDAARLGEALAGMKKDVKNKYVGDMVDQSVKLLTVIEKGGKATGASGLFDWLNKNPAPTKELFKGVADSAVKRAAEEVDD